MRRLGLVAAAPLVVAVLLAVTGGYRAGGPDPRAPTTEAAAAEPAASAPVELRGPVVLGGQAGQLAVGLAAAPDGEGRLAVEATVLDGSGELAGGREVAFATGGRSVAGRPCGPGRYCARLPIDLPARVRVRVGGAGGGSAAFSLPADWRPAGDLVARATRVFRGLRSVAYRERLRSGTGTTLVSRWRVEAPNRLAYEIEGGGAAVVVGDRRWDRDEEGPWLASPQRPPLRVPAPPWSGQARDAALIGSGSIGGRAAWVVSFRDQAALPTWFTVWIEKRTSRTLAVRMTTAAHFMEQRYERFDRRLSIEPPRSARPLASSRP